MSDKFEPYSPSYPPFDKNYFHFGWPCSTRGRGQNMPRHGIEGDVLGGLYKIFRNLFWCSFMYFRFDQSTHVGNSEECRLSKS